MNIPEPLLRYHDAIEEELWASQNERMLPIYRMMQYQMGWVNELGEPLPRGSTNRLRASLCLVANNIMGGSTDQALPAAAAVELVHNFSLIHHHIQEGSPQHRNRDTVWWLWGPAQAINAGDGMHALGRLAIFRLGERDVSPGKVLQAVQLLDEACLGLCEGQYLDFMYQERIDITTEQYFEMAEGKTGALIGCALQLGAIVACDDSLVIDAMGVFGRKLGVALQIHADLMNLLDSACDGEGRTQISGEVLNKSKSFPVVYALENATIGQKRALGNIYFKRVMEPSDLAKVVEILENVGAVEYTRKIANVLAQDAVRTLKAHGVDGTEDLRKIASYLVKSG